MSQEQPPKVSGASRLPAVQVELVHKLVMKIARVPGLGLIYVAIVELAHCNYSYDEFVSWAVKAVGRGVVGIYSEFTTEDRVGINFCPRCLLKPMASVVHFCRS